MEALPTTAHDSDRPVYLHLRDRLAQPLVVYWTGAAMMLLMAVVAVAFIHRREES